MNEVRAGVVLAFALLCGAGCTKASRASDPGGTTPAASAAAPPSAAGASSPHSAPSGAGAAASVDTANYLAAIAAPSSACKKSEPCAVSVVLEAKGDYHINDKYPYRFKVDDPAPAGVSYPKALVGRDDADIETKKATLKVPFVAAASGQAEIGGVLSLSVCSAANCLIDRQALKVSVRVDD
jgi:hypothetical protein